MMQNIIWVLFCNGMSLFINELLCKLFYLHPSLLPLRHSLILPKKKWVDVTAADPKLLVHLKSYRNTVPVPPHWSQKRKYLQAKRGIEKPPFELPGNDISLLFSD